MTVDGATVGSDPAGSLPMQPGQHTVVVTATDAAGNQAPLTRTYTVTGIARAGRPEKARVRRVASSRAVRMASL